MLPAPLRAVAGECIGDGELAIGAVWNHRVTGLERGLDVIERHGDKIWLQDTKSETGRLIDVRTSSVNSRA